LLYKVLNTATFGASKGFLESIVPRGEGLKTLNALDLEKTLLKDLKKLQSLSDAKTGGELEVKLNQIIKENQAKPAPIPKGETSKSTIKAADLGNKPLPKTIKITDYKNPDYPRYATPDMLDRIQKILTLKENINKPIDMLVSEVQKRIVNMGDVKLGAQQIKKLIIKMNDIIKIPKKS